MILTYEQADRFYTLINALLGYANERFEVVRELPLPIVDLESQSKAALVGEQRLVAAGAAGAYGRQEGVLQREGRRHEGRPQRPLPLRQRQEVQEVLRKVDAPRG